MKAIKLSAQDTLIVLRGLYTLRDAIKADASKDKFTKQELKQVERLIKRIVG